MVKSELYRHLIRWQTLVACICMVAMYIQGFEDYRPLFPEQIPYDNNFVSAFLHAQGAGGWSVVPAFFALLVPLISGDSLAQDRRTRYTEYIRMRVSAKQYILYKIMAAAISSGIFIVFTAMLAFLYSLFTYESPSDLSQVESYPPTFAFDLFVDHPYLYMMMTTLNMAVMAMVVSTAALLSSIFIRNAYVVLTIPFIIFLLLQVAFNSIGTSVARYSPVELTAAYISNNFTYHLFEIISISLCILGFISIVTYLVFIFRNKKGLI